MKHVLALRHLTFICMRTKSNDVLFLSLNKVKKYFSLIIIIIIVIIRTSSYNFINGTRCPPFFDYISSKNQRFNVRRHSSLRLEECNRLLLCIHLTGWNISHGSIYLCKWKAKYSFNQSISDDLVLVLYYFSLVLILIHVFIPREVRWYLCYYADDWRYTSS